MSNHSVAVTGLTGVQAVPRGVTAWLSGRDGVGLGLQHEHGSGRDDNPADDSLR